MTNIPVISKTGLWTPEESVSNAELVESFNAWSTKWNDEHAEEIAAGTVEAKPLSNVEFIEKASGIKSRYVINKSGIVDPDIMRPVIPERPDTDVSVLAEIAVNAARQALDAAGRDASEIDAVICAASNMQRAYPAMAVEIQDALGINGFGFDMNVACSSATFGIQTAADFVRSGSAKSVLMVNPEICSGHLNFTDRDSHFIFGDVATAVLVENKDITNGDHWEILGSSLKTQFSNNIRNNFGFLNRAAPETRDNKDKLFVQEGRKVFKEVVPMVVAMIQSELDRLNLQPTDLKRMWLHQANANMNRLIAAKVLGREATPEDSPTVLDTYANTSSAGSIIAFHKHCDDFEAGDRGLICSFGAGYSAGTVMVEKSCA
ncbi:MAG: beta-ketoacyl-ACP synthase III [Hyphomonadaceae bacterium]|nr:beta-ketoacyl-ACP synthase III [Hyphomonadaceae bacterium]OUX95946.1 MAG: beta-ketoacyl-ACP synthase III [Hyphomonas sp. TMED17]CAI8330029.1 MAG: Beta-ketodecanoyl-[acyl-carrier-protein] synthase [Hyphomonas sp. TMED17]